MENSKVVRSIQFLLEARAQNLDHHQSQGKFWSNWTDPRKSDRPREWRPILYLSVEIEGVDVFPVLVGLVAILLLDLGLVGILLRIELPDLEALLQLF